MAGKVPKGEPVLKVDVMDRIAVLTLNRPERRNALNSALATALDETVRRLDGDPEVDVMILTGVDPAFCAGIDLVEMPVAAGTVGFRPQRTFRGMLPPSAKPIIGAINGPTVTGGLELALSCDLLVASDRARFADTHARVGVMPGGGLSVRLARWVGEARAKEMSITGNFVRPETALQWGLVNHVVPHDELIPFCRDLAADVVDNDQQAVRTLLATYDRGMATTAEEAWAVEAEARSAWVAARQGQELKDVPDRRLDVVRRGRQQLER